jgi:hypothetical protein
MKNVICKRCSKLMASSFHELPLDQNSLEVIILCDECLNEFAEYCECQVPPDIASDIKKELLDQRNTILNKSKVNVP